jgi:hypothetical protein
VGLFKNLLQNHQARKDHIYMKAFKKEIYWQCDLMAIKKSNAACVHRRNISQYDSGEQCGPWASCLFINLSLLNVMFEKGDICYTAMQNMQCVLADRKVQVILQMSLFSARPIVELGERLQTKSRIYD